MKRTSSLRESVVDSVLGGSLAVDGQAFHFVVSFARGSASPCRLSLAGSSQLPPVENTVYHSLPAVAVAWHYSGCTIPAEGSVFDLVEWSTEQRTEILARDGCRNASVGCEPGSCSAVQVFAVPESLVGTVDSGVLVVSMPGVALAVVVEKKELVMERSCSPESKGESCSWELVVPVEPCGNRSRRILECFAFVPKKVEPKNPKLFGFVQLCCCSWWEQRKKDRP